MSQSRVGSHAGPSSFNTNLPALEPTSMTSILLTPLTDLQSLSQTLFLSLSLAPNQKPPLAPHVSLFLETDATLASALSLARTHQIRQRKIEALKGEILELDHRWMEICQEMERGRRELEKMIEEGEERIANIEKAKEVAIPYPELLAYAQSLSAFTSAPPNMPDLTLPGQLPPPLFFPPFPNEEKMRRGRLNAEAPLGILGETHSVGRPPTASPPRPPEQTAAMGPITNSYRPDQRQQQQQFFDLDLDLNPDL